MANQFVVQLTNEPGAMATLAEALAAARRGPAGDRRRQHRRHRPRDHDDRGRRDAQRSSTSAATRSSRASRSSSRWTTGRAGWPAWRVHWPMPTSTSSATCSSADGAIGRRSRSSSTSRTSPVRSWSARTDASVPASSSSGAIWAMLWPFVLDGRSGQRPGPSPFRPRPTTHRPDRAPPRAGGPRQERSSPCPSIPLG